MASEQQYLDLFRTGRALIDEGSCAPLNACRQAAAEALAVHGLPTRHTERYRYVDVEAALAPDYGLNLRRALSPQAPSAAFRCSVPGLSTSLFVVMNDVVVPAAPGAAPLPGGSLVCSLAEAAAAQPELLSGRYHAAAARTYDALTALNTMLVQDGILVYVPAGTVLERPVQLVSLAAAGADLMSNRRLLVVLGEGAQASLLLCDHAPGRSRSLTTQVTEIYLGRDARLDLCAVEETGERNARFHNLYVEQEAGSRLSAHAVGLSGGLTRTQADVRLLGPGAEVRADGAVVAAGRQRVDHNLLVDHAAPRCASDLLFKYVLDGAAVGAFAGKVLVRPGAQQTLSQQTNANLCASPEARAYAQPMLEIYADDVKCNHGSTVGKLDESALFYLRQRGIPEAEARLLLQHAFVNDVLSRIAPEALRDRLSFLVENRFRGVASRCQGCRLCS